MKHKTTSYLEDSTETHLWGLSSGEESIDMTSEALSMKEEKKKDKLNFSKLILTLCKRKG